MTNKLLGKRPSTVKFSLTFPLKYAVRKNVQADEKIQGDGSFNLFRSWFVYNILLHYKDMHILYCAEFAHSFFFVFFFDDIV
jgi:hypothetical protein